MGSRRLVKSGAIGLERIVAPESRCQSRADIQQNHRLLWVDCSPSRQAGIGQLLPSATGCNRPLTSILSTDQDSRF